MTVGEILQAMNAEDHTVAKAVAAVLPAVESFVKQLVSKVRDGGRLFYIGAGTSGRLGVVDASEIPPTFGVSEDVVVGLIAGGDGAIRKAVEFAEDSTTAAWDILQHYQAGPADCVLAISASGTTPYVLHGLKACREHGIVTACLCCNQGSPVSAFADYAIEPDTGPEFLTGSTRLKSGTAQKLVLNMISTALMLRLGHVRGNRMVDMQLTNQKLVQRGIAMLCEHFLCSEADAMELLKRWGSVRAALDSGRPNPGNKQ